MNLGQNVLTWFLANVQPLILLAIGVIGLYGLIERKFSKVVGMILLGIVAVGFVYNTEGVKDMFLNLFNSFFA